MSWQRLFTNPRVIGADQESVDPGGGFKRHRQVVQGPGQRIQFPHQFASVAVRFMMLRFDYEHRPTKLPCIESAFGRSMFNRLVDRWIDEEALHR